MSEAFQLPAEAASRSTTHLGAEVAAPLAAGHLQLWLVRIERAPGAMRLASFALSAEEEARADRFARADLRNLFRLTRGVTRRIVGQACRVQPEDVVFAAGEHGKPFVADEPTLAFNASHSKDQLLIGLMRGGNADGDQNGIGVDIEAVRDLPCCLDIAQRVFSPARVAALASLGGAARQAQFFREWVIWEAQLKARGLGIAAAECAGLLRTPDDSLSHGLIDAGVNYAAAWASQLPITSLSIRPCVAALNGHGDALAFSEGPARSIPDPSAAWRLQ